jgi:hypothetical protein
MSGATFRLFCRFAQVGGASLFSRYMPLFDDVQLKLVLTRTRDPSILIA